MQIFSARWSAFFLQWVAQVCSILRFRLSVERSHVLRCGHRVETALSLPLHMIQVPFVFPPFFSRVTSPHKTAELLRRLRAQICTMFEKMFVKNSVNSAFVVLKKFFKCRARHFRGIIPGKGKCTLGLAAHPNPWHLSSITKTIQKKYPKTKNNDPGIRRFSAT